MGAWAFIQPHIANLLPNKDYNKVNYVGRRVSASPATGTFFLKLDFFFFNFFF